MEGRHRNLWRWLLAAYGLFLFLAVAVKFDGSLAALAQRRAVWADWIAHGWGGNWNLVPFDSLRVQLAQLPRAWAWRNLAANLLAFFPLRLLLPLAVPRCRRLHWTAVVSLAVILSIELFQLLTRLGSFDVDDLLLNFPAALAGWVLWRLLDGEKRAKC